MALLGAYLVIVQALVELCLQEFVLIRQHEDPAQDSTIFWTQVLSSVILASLTLLAAPALARLVLGSREWTAVLQASVIALPLQAATRVPEAQLRRNQQYSRLAFRGILSTTLAGTLSLALAWMGAGVWALVARALTEAVTDVVLAFVLSGWRPSAAPKLRLLALPLRQSMPLVGTRLLDILAGQTDRVIVGHMLGLPALGIYNLATRIQTLTLEAAFGAVNETAVTTLARVRDNPKEFRRYYVRLANTFAYIGLTLSALVFILAPLAIPTLLGQQWRASAGVVQILCLSSILVSVLPLTTSILFAAGDTRAILFQSVMSAGTRAVLCFAGGMYASISGASAGLVLSTLITVLIGLRLRSAYVAQTVAEVIWQQAVPILVSVGSAFFCLAAVLMTGGLPAYLSIAISLLAGILGAVATFRFSSTRRSTETTTRSGAD